MTGSLRRAEPRRSARGRLIVLSVLAILLATALVSFAAGFFDAPPSPTGGVTPTSSIEVPSATPAPGDPTGTPVPTGTPTPEPTPTVGAYPTPDFSKNLSNPDDFFGPLPTVSDPKKADHFPVRALYVAGGVNMTANLALIKSSEDLNTVVVDLKESDGIYFKSKNAMAISIGAVKGGIDLKSFAATCHAAGVRVIGRIVIFKDPILAKARPDLCLRDQAGNTLQFSNEGGLAFVSPYRQEVWDYNIALAQEAVALGVDEIQFDYVRFPTGGTKSGAAIYVGPTGMYPTRIQTINRFLSKAKVEITDRLGIPLGADLFGIILSSRTDGKNLGQDWASVGLVPGIDNLCPMIYPSHYANSSTTHYSGNGTGTYLNGILFKKPDLEPYAVMYNALLLGKTSTQQAGYSAVRTYLQAFTASYLPSGYYQTYGADEIAAQIKAIRDAGYSEYICWNSKASYPAAAFD
jgi:hypothetical protein